MLENSCFIDDRKQCCEHEEIQLEIVAFLISHGKNEDLSIKVERSCI